MSDTNPTTLPPDTAAEIANIESEIGRFLAGTLAPEPMDARTDGALGGVLWTAPPPPAASAAFRARYSRYAGPQDALCCPSAISTVYFEVRTAGIVPGASVLVPLRVETAPNPAG